MKKLIIPSLLIFLALAVSCTPGLDFDFSGTAHAVQEGPVFFASIEEQPVSDTKVYADDQLRVLWNADDRISIFNKNTSRLQYRFEGEDGENAGSFARVTEEVPSGTELSYVYAVYPYSETTRMSNGGEMTLMLPAVQPYKADSFGPGVNTMVSVSNGYLLLFRNLCGYLTFKLYGDDMRVRRIELRGNHGEKLAGEAKVKMAVGDVPVATMAADAAESIVLECEEPVLIGPDADHCSEFWFAVPPVKLTNGFSITVTDEEGNVIVKSTSKEREIVRNMKATMAPIKIEPMSITFDASDLVVMPANATRDIHYSIHSDTDKITIETKASGDVEASVVKTDARTGAIRVTSGASIQEGSAVVVLVSNGSQGLMRKLNFGGESIEEEENATKEVAEEGGSLNLEFFSDAPCRVLIPEDARSWISVVGTKSPDWQTIALNIQPNDGAARSATVTVRSEDGTLVLPYLIEQEDDRDYQLVSEREALMKIYDALSPESQATLPTWGTHAPLSDWESIDVDSRGFVTMLNLRVEFVKALPPEICALKHLKQIWIMPFNFSCDIEGIEGVSIPGEIGELAELEVFYLSHANFVGTIPKEFAKLKHLKHLTITETAISGEIPPELGEIKSLEELALSFNPLTGTIPKELGNLVNLRSLQLHGKESQLSGSIPKELCYLPKLEELFLGAQLSGEIPHEIGNLTNLKRFAINWSNISGQIPEEIGYLSNLEYLAIDDSPITGIIPESIRHCSKLTEFKIEACPVSGSIPSWLSELQNLKYISFYMTHLSGVIPKELALLPNLRRLELACCPYLYGNIPEELLAKDVVKYGWGNLVNGTNFNLIGVKIPAPEFHVSDLDGHIVDSATEYENNDFTVLFQWNYWCPSIEETPKLVELYNKYHERGLNVIGWSDDDAEEYLSHPKPMRETIAEYGMPWSNFVVPLSNFEGSGTFGNFTNKYPGEIAGVIALVDKDGFIIWSNLYDSMENLFKIVEEYYAGSPTSGAYKSTDYSADGQVVKLQSAAKGNGIDLVFMGDGYSDRLIADGTYDAVMNQMVTSFFSEEPYASLREYFNVYVVKVVSDYESSDDGFTALRTWFGEGTKVGGNNALCVHYALKAVPDNRIDNATVVVAINSTAFGGTCYMYLTELEDYGQGLSVSYFPVGTDPDRMAAVLHHEAGGHGFAKLADEYVSDNTGAVYQQVIDEARAHERFGWWKNIDFTNDPAQVKWARFLADARYANEGLGCYEGAFTYLYGVWRPTENSIMRYNTGGFNAPSRYAIWYRIGKLAYGSDWTGGYEDFVTFDSSIRMSSAAAHQATKSLNYVEKQLPPLAPPVVIDHSWRDEL